MTPDDVRAAAQQLVEIYEEFAPLFGKRQAQNHAFDYINGLMTCPERKSVEPIAGGRDDKSSRSRSDKRS